MISRLGGRRRIRVTGLDATAAWTPLALPGIQAYWRADALSLSNNDPVTTLTDMTGNGNDLIQAGAARPTFITGVQNGLPAVRSSGTTQYLQCSAASKLNSTTGSVFLLLKTASANGFACIKATQFNFGTSSENLNSYDWGGSTNRTTTFDIVDSAFHQIGMTYVSGAASGFKRYGDGVARATDYTFTISDQSGKFSVFGYGGGDGIGGDLLEGVAANQAWTLADIVQLKNFWWTKYAIP